MATEKEQRLMGEITRLQKLLSEKTAEIKKLQRKLNVAQGVLQGMTDKKERE